MTLKINKTYIKWTPAERADVARAIRASINAEGHGASDLDDVKQRLHRPGFLDFLGEGRVRTAFNNGDYLKMTALLHQVTAEGLSAQALENAHKFLEQEPPKPTAYEVEGVGAMTVADMMAFVTKWHPFTKAASEHFAKFGTDPLADALAYRTPTPAPAPLVLDVQVHIGKGKPTTAEVTVQPPAPKHTPVVCIAGLHSKHRDALNHEYRGKLRIDYIEQRANDSQIKAHVSARKCVVFEPGVNGNVLKLINNIAAKVYPCHGMARLREHLDSITKGN